MQNSALYRWPRVPTTQFCYPDPDPEPEGHVQFSFWTHCCMCLSPTGRGACEPALNGGAQLRRASEGSQFLPKLRSGC